MEKYALAKADFEQKMTETAQVGIFNTLNLNFLFCLHISNFCCKIFYYSEMLKCTILLLQLIFYYYNFYYSEMLKCTILLLQLMFYYNFLIIQKC